MSSLAPTLSSDPDVLVHGLTTVELQALSAKCLEARETAYCPYSLFRVGCAILLRSSPTHDPLHLSSTPIITGANVENASYPVGTCAERVAMATAIIQGYRRGSFKAVAVATDMDDFCSPCGMCRQFLREFCEDETPIIMHAKTGQYKVKMLGELLPMSFGPEALPKRELLEVYHTEKPKTT
ncbi:cytidine deaminase [Lepidopterella palustris CBS 459.81]|uniref:Cytidine deaminase n=1 Tax=Lepidopterella palustris CBS 459.81 TaxID=1314670 RepID=A0A8E2JK97_9PEZI|nr:cytidine deaminase [Lepidopterella palustris CBS 459.81]